MITFLSNRRTKINAHSSEGGDLLILAHSHAIDQSPAAVYIAQLKQSSRRPQKQALDLVASLLSGGRADCLTLNGGCYPLPVRGCCAMSFA